jgi:uncharacterized protein (UPF0332 family)
MTDREALYSYRLAQAEETLQDAKLMQEHGGSPRSIINRAYYAMFYAVLALFLHAGTMAGTSKHSGVISVFDKEFVAKGRIDKYYSKILRKTFEVRQDSDYKEFKELSYEDAATYIRLAYEFLSGIKRCVSEGQKGA